MRWVGHVARDMKNACKSLVEKPEGSRPLKRQRHWWKDNIRMELWEIVWEGVHWMHLAQDKTGTSGRPVNMVMNFQVPW